MAENNKKLVAFNIKNAKYALKQDTGYTTPVALGYSDSLALEADYSEKKINGDGRIIKVIPNDKGKTGTLTLLTIDDAYEISMKRRMKTANGTSEIKQYASIEQALYYEFEYMEEDGDIRTAKVWMYGVTSGRPSESLSQTTEDINNNNVDYALTIKGTPLMDSVGTAQYVDVSGNAIYVWQECCLPGDTGYADFGTTCKSPKALPSTPIV